MKKILRTAAIAGGGIIAAKALDARLETTRYTIRSSKIPRAFDGYKIAQISDIHSDSVPGLVPEIRAENPDIIVSTGDLIHHSGGYDSALSLIDTLLDIAPVYAVSGNHETWRGDCAGFSAALEELGAVLPHNRTVTLKKGGERIGLSGIDDPFSVVSRKIHAFLDEAVSALEPDRDYNILLFHRANWLDYFKNSGFDLIISGHMHGGQMRIPGLGGLVSPRSSWSGDRPILFPKYAGGRYALGETTLIVSRGLGNPMLIPRVFNRPELVIITLKHKTNY